jgi:hypothetical protein
VLRNHTDRQPNSFPAKRVITHLAAVVIPNTETQTDELESMTSFFRKHRKGFTTGMFIIVFKIGIVLRNICHLLLNIFTFAIAAVIFDKTRISRAKGNMKLHALLLTKYLWRIIKM